MTEPEFVLTINGREVKWRGLAIETRNPSGLPRYTVVVDQSKASSSSIEEALRSAALAAATYPEGGSL